MSSTLREALARQANDAGLPDLNIDELVGLGEARLRRRRFAAVAAVTAAVVAVVGGAALARPDTRRTAPPPTRRDQSHDSGP